jgi:hypothetical protein
MRELVRNWSNNKIGMDLVDSMYQQVLADLFIAVHDMPEPFHSRQIILHSILCTEERVSIMTLAEMLGNERGNIEEVEETISTVMECLHAVLRISNGKIEWYHTSFLDFMFNPLRSNFTYGDHRLDLYCDVASQHKVLGRCCFQVMRSSLRFNICSLPSSYAPDSEVEGLDEQVKKYIREGLAYACLYWAGHLASGQYNAFEQDIVDKDLESFLNGQLLFWMEATSLLKKPSQCGAALNKVQKWLKKVSYAGLTTQYLTCLSRRKGNKICC